MKFALVFLAVCVAYVSGECNHQSIIDNCQSFATEMQDKERQKDKTEICKSLNGYLECMKDAGCLDDKAYKSALDGMRDMKKQMECSAATGLVPSLTTLIFAVFAFILYK
ncbi:uncharacterized protein LOC121370847 [Gigantopelta aegis]|uniref:uncharacterized protein LOC121370847 n=1 Tax=Gigantopelta aegis TaxID=1735272 RepID=UPI001B887C1A|nr:uncharacterized protein LOC121370847 [Gigantopelta aegis]